MLDKLINPKSIAVIGASENPEKIGYQILKNLISGGYEGEIIPVNPKSEEILKLKTYKSIGDAPAADLAIIVIPAKFVKETVLECAGKKIPSIIIISAGFAEIDEAGQELQSEIAALCRQKNITLLGPNCLGLINTKINLNASFARDMPNSGSISFISQSGAIISSLIDWSKNSSIGFAKIFSVGNKALLSEAELLEYLYKDSETKVILGYFESFEATEKLSEVLIRYAKTKPTIFLFGGKSESGAKAAASHTGSIVSSYLAVQTYLKQAGVITANGIEDLLLSAQVFSFYRKVGGKNVAIITNAGGPGIATSDELSAQKLNLAKIDEKTKALLKTKLRPAASVKNPVDVLGDANEIEYGDALSIIEKDKNVDAIIVLLTPQSATKISETANIIADFKSAKPIICSFVGGEILLSAKKIIESSGKLCFSFPEEAVSAIKLLSDFSENSFSLKRRISPDKKIDLKNIYSELKKFNLPAIEYFETTSIDKLMEFIDKIGYPVVLKTNSKEIVHKMDSGGVKLNISNSIELHKAFDELNRDVKAGPMIHTKYEIFLGAKKDPQIGTVIAFGTGGIFAEIYQDFSYRIAPIDLNTAKEMILESKMGLILVGARGQRKYDLERLAQIIVSSSNFIDNFANISELDFNPIIADDKGFYHIVDARIITS